MEKLIKELEQLKKECSFSQSFIEPYLKDGIYDWGNQSSYEDEQLNNRLLQVYDLKPKIKALETKLKDKQKRIDSFATATLMGMYSNSSIRTNPFDKTSEAYDVAELMEEERERRINALNK